MTSVTHCGRQKKKIFLRLQRRRCPGSCDRDPGPFTKKRKKKREREKKKRGCNSYLHSSRMTLSPKITVSNSPCSMSLFKMCLQGLLRAFESMAQTPILPIFGSELISKLGADVEEPESWGADNEGSDIAGTSWLLGGTDDGDEESVGDIWCEVDWLNTDRKELTEDAMSEGELAISLVCEGMSIDGEGVGCSRELAGGWPADWDLTEDMEVYEGLEGARCCWNWFWFCMGIRNG